MRARTVFSLLVFAGALLIGARLLRRVTGGGTAHGQLFDQVLARVERDYVDTLDPSELYRRAAVGMVAQLHDPYSSVLDERRYRLFAQLIGRPDDGIGVRIESRDGALRVIAPLPDSPAERAGLHAGDRIVEIGGRASLARSVETAQAALRGAPGDSVTLLIERPGATEPTRFTIRRDGSRVAATRHAMMLAPGAGYVQLAVSADSSATQLRRAVEGLREHGARTLLIDLRADPGGLLEQGVAVADEFLNVGQSVVSLRGRAPYPVQTIADSVAQRWPGLLLVVLVDGATASSAELVAGALQDHDRAAVVGSTTFGKGSAQALFPLTRDAGALRLTTALWFTPSGRSIQRPHVAAGDSAPPRAAGTEPPLAGRRAFRTDAGRVVYGGGGITPDLIVTPQDSFDGTRALQRALGTDLPRFSDAAAAVATAAATSARAGAAPREGAVAVTPAMRAALWARVHAEGMHLARAQFDSSPVAVDRMLGDQYARAMAGAEAAYRNRLAGDQVVTAALALTRGAASEREIFARAAARRAANREDVERVP